MAYLKDATDFTDIEMKQEPALRGEWAVENPPREFHCGVCHGYGSWNLRLNAYGEGKHFQSSCTQCNGWGWVTKADSECIHDWVELSERVCTEQGITHYGMCWHVYKCSKCDKHWHVDSSD